jgi:hypothetical protein
MTLIVIPAAAHAAVAANHNREARGDIAHDATVSRGSVPRSRSEVRRGPGRIGASARCGALSDRVTGMRAGMPEHGTHEAVDLPDRVCQRIGLVVDRAREYGPNGRHDLVLGGDFVVGARR